MKNLESILIDTFNSSSSTTFNDATMPAVCEPLIYTYNEHPLGFEACAFIDMESAISSGFYNNVLESQISKYKDDTEIDHEYLYELEKFIDYYIRVNLENNRITAYCSLDYPVELLSEELDLDNFEAQCKKFVDLF